MILPYFPLFLYCGFFSLLMMMSISERCIAPGCRVRDMMMEIDDRDCAGYPV